MKLKLARTTLKSKPKSIELKKVEDEFYINLPKGRKEYEIEKITYVPIFDLKQNIRGIEQYSIK